MELGGRVCLSVCLFVFFCPSRYDARHRKPRRCVYAWNLGGTGISPPDKIPPGQKSPRPKVPPAKSAYGQKNPGEKVPRAKDPRTVLVFVLVFVFVLFFVIVFVPSGDIFYCSGSRQLNHSSCCCCHDEPTRNFLYALQPQ